MDVRLIAIFAGVALTLILNTVMIFFAYKAFASVSNKVTDGVHEFQSSASTRQWLMKLQSTSEQAVRVTGSIKAQLVGLEPALERMQASHTERLSKADVRFKLAFRAIHFVAESVEQIVNRPVKNVQAVAAGLQGIISFIRGSESGADARSRRNR